MEYLKNLISPEHKGLLTGIEGGGGELKKCKTMKKTSSVNKKLNSNKAMKHAIQSTV